MKNEMSVAVLCAAVRSVYFGLPGVDVYNLRRNAYSFKGGMPVIAHPPCRLWSVRVSHQAKCSDPESERNLGFWCVTQVKRYGGILEQPAFSRLFMAAGLPLPGGSISVDGFSISVYQFWWGHQVSKPTWLFISGADSLPAIPFRLLGQETKWKNLSQTQRSATPLLFAKWLLEVARRCSKKGDVGLRVRS